MARSLNVFLDQDFVGQLIQDDGGQMLFEYAESWLEGPDPIPLSRSLPLRKERFTQKECRGFFGGTLPEEDNRKIIARILGISDKNDFAMLEQIGGECAGAITFLPEETKVPKDDTNYRELSDAELARILRELPRRPLMAGEDGIRLSLAGAQDKIAVRVQDGKVSVPRGSAPSSHILKPAIATYDGVVFNEAFCMTLAAQAGLDSAGTTIGHIEGIDYLLVERYDRHQSEDGQIQRVHQEDFCQALGVPSEVKYQSEGGPSLTDCFSLLRDASSSPVIDLTRLLDAVLFNMLIGNHDAHAKNFSLLYMPNHTIRLAPLYDLVSTILYPELTDKMAMKLGGKAKSILIFPENVEKFARDAGLAVPPTLARVSTLATIVLEAIPSVEKPDELSEKVAKLIGERCEKFASRFRKT
jgi:serine/threonine-protein kinase HipA